MNILIAILIVFLILLIAEKLEAKLGKFKDIFWVACLILVIVWLLRGTPGL